MARVYICWKDRIAILILLVKESFVTGEFCLVFFRYQLLNFCILRELMYSRHLIALTKTIVTLVLNEVVCILIVLMWSAIF